MCQKPDSAGDDLDECIQVKRIAQIFHILNENYNIDNRFSDKKAKEFITKWVDTYQIDNNVADYYFLANVCMGP